MPVSVLVVDRAHHVDGGVPTLAVVDGFDPVDGRRPFASGNGTQAALVAYETTDRATARSIASENLTKPDVRAAVDEILDAEGLGDAELHAVHAHFLALHRSEDPQEKAMALKALDMAYRLKGAYRSNAPRGREPMRREPMRPAPAEDTVPSVEGDPIALLLEESRRVVVVAGEQQRVRGSAGHGSDTTR